MVTCVVKFKRIIVNVLKRTYCVFFLRVSLVAGFRPSCCISCILHYICYASNMFWICMVSTLATSPLWKQFDLNSLKMEAKIKNNNNTSVSCRGHCMALTMGSKPEPLCTSSLCAADCSQSNTTFYCLTTCTAWWMHLKLNTAEICLTFGCLYGRSKKKRSVCVRVRLCCLSVNCTATQTLAVQDNWISNFKVMHITLKGCKCIPLSTFWSPSKKAPPHTNAHTHTPCHQKQAISH